MIYYAIREVGTNNYLPASKRRSGFTHDEPVNIDSCPPRLFTKRQYAQSALDWWLQGQFKEAYSELVRIRGSERTDRKMEIITLALIPRENFDPTAREDIGNAKDSI